MKKKKNQKKKRKRLRARRKNARRKKNKERKKKTRRTGYSQNSFDLFTDELLDDLFFSMFSDTQVPPSTQFISGLERQEIFLEDMHKYAKQTGVRSEFVEFESNWAEYREMDFEQLNYYLYWRECARNHEYLPASFNYFSIYQAELINLVGVDSVEEARKELEKLWVEENHNIKFILTPTGKLHIAQEIFDFYYFNKLNTRKMNPEIVNNIGSFERLTLLLDRMDRSRPFDLPSAHILGLADYDFEEKSRIYDEDPDLYYEIVENVFYVLDYQKRQKEKKGILDTFFHDTTIHPKIAYFPASYVESRRYNSDKVLTHYRAREVSEYFTSVLYHIENTLRSLFHYMGRYRKYSLPDWEKEEIETFLKTYYTAALDKRIPGRLAAAKNYIQLLTEGRKVEINTDKLEKLQAETETVQKILEVEDAVEESEDSTAYVEELKHILSNLIKMEPAYAGIFKDLAAGENPKEIDQERINKAAMRFLNSPLLVLDKGRLVINTLYLPSLKYLYENIDTFSFLNATEVDDEVRSFLDDLSPEHYEVLRIIAHDSLPGQAILEVAEANMTLPDLLYDEINDQALLYLDDIVIELDESGNPVLLEEYSEQIKKITESEKRDE